MKPTFIELTNVCNKIYVNPNFIITFGSISGEKKTYLRLADEYRFEVTETPDEIQTLIDKAYATHSQE